MKHKSETFEKFKEFQSEVKIIVTKKLSFHDLIMEVSIWVMSLVFISNNAEYFCNSRHLQHHSVMVCLNVINRTLLDMVRSMMSLTDLSLSFWGYALEIAAFTLNRAPSKSVETTPYELWFGKKPKLSFLKF